MLWCVALFAAFPFYGVINSTINIFYWWLAWISALEFLTFIPLNLENLPALFRTPLSQEQISIFMGVPAFAAWVWTLTIVGQSDDRRGKILEALLVFTFVPPLALLGIKRLLEKVEPGTASEESADVPDSAV